MATAGNIRPIPVPAQIAASHFVTIAKSDSVNFAEGPCDAIYVGGAGVVQVVRWDDVVVPFTVPAGGYLHVKAKRVNSSSTDATLMVALYA